MELAGDDGDRPFGGARTACVVDALVWRRAVELKWRDELGPQIRIVPMVAHNRLVTKGTHKCPPP
jgi:hypothetical protein